MKIAVLAGRRMLKSDLPLSIFYSLHPRIRETILHDYVLTQNALFNRLEKLTITPSLKIVKAGDTEEGKAKDYEHATTRYVMVLIGFIFTDGLCTIVPPYYTSLKQYTYIALETVSVHVVIGTGSNMRHFYVECILS